MIESGCIKYFIQSVFGSAVKCIERYVGHVVALIVGPYQMKLIPMSMQALVGSYNGEVSMEIEARRLSNRPQQTFPN